MRRSVAVMSMDTCGRAPTISHSTYQGAVESRAPGWASRGCMNLPVRLWPLRVEHSTKKLKTCWRTIDTRWSWRGIASHATALREITGLRTSMKSVKGSSPNASSNLAMRRASTTLGDLRRIDRTLTGPSEGSVATSKAVTEEAPSGTGRRGLRQPDRTAGR